MNPLPISSHFSPLKRHRILFVFDCLELGGAERQALHLARHLSDNVGADVSVLGLSQQKGTVSTLCSEAGIPCQGVICRVPGKRYDWLTSLWVLYKAIRHVHPTIILPSTWRPNVLCGLLWKFTGAKHCVWNQRDEGRCLDNSFWHRTAVRMSSSYMSNTLQGRDFLLGKYGLSEGQVKVIQNGVALDQPVLDRKGWRIKLGLDDSTFVACMVGNLHKFKDHATLVKAWSKVLKLAQPEHCNAILLLAGRFSGAEQELQTLVQELDLVDSVKFLNKVDDISGLLGSVDLCVHSSLTEGLPNALLEAMASGLPVVGSNIPGVREALGDKSAWLLVPVGDESAMACKILEFMNNEVLRDKVGCELKQRAESHYKLSSMLDKTVENLESLINLQSP